MDVLVNGTSVGAVTSYNFPSITTDKTISATFAINTYTITPSIVGGNGTVSPATVQTVNYGATPTFTFAPATGYHLQTVTVNGTSVTPSGNSYTFPTVITDKTIVGTFAINTYTITASSGANGAVTPAGVTTVNYGATPTYAITPATGYHVADVLVNGTSVGAVTSYTFPSVTGDKTISATFAINTYTITASSGANGAVTPVGVTTVNYGATPTYAITPASGYNVVDVLVNSTSVGAVTSYTFPSVTTDKTISATFAQNPRTQIYYEGFESGTGGWSFTGDNSRRTDAVPKNLTADIRLRNTGSMTRTISTTGDMDIVVQFAWVAQSLDSASEYVRAEYSTNGGTSWNTISQITGPTASPTTLTIVTSSVLPVAANNNPNFRLRFSIAGNNANDLLYVDDVKVTGIPI